MNCQYCDNPVPAGATKCPACGAAVPQQQQQQAQPQQEQYVQQPPTQKSPFLAELLSCLIVGVGQMYNGQVLKGVTLLIVNIIIGVATGGVGTFVLWIVAIIDAGKIAKKINLGRQVGPWEFF